MTVNWHNKIKILKPIKFVINYLRQSILILLIGIALFTGLMFSHTSVAALAKPLTPEAAQYEIGQANNPEEAGETLKQQARDHKQELRRDTAYTRQAVKNRAKATKNALQEGVKTIQDKTHNQNDDNRSR